MPYFGKLPNYFDIWLYTAGKNPDFDFFIYTDSKDIPDTKFQNIFVKYMTFDDFKSKLQNVIDIPITLDKPYKLCDYRPVYGKALADDLKKYDFWGHCDLDLIFGNLSHFISDEILDQYDRIYNLGHLTIYRNCDEMNNLFMQRHPYKDCFSYKYAFSTDFATAFDEIGTKYGYGISTVCARKGIKNYISIDFADVLPDTYNFELAYTEHEKVDYFLYQNGSVYGMDANGKKIKEFLYVHLQKRNMAVDTKEKDTFYISPSHLRSTLEETLQDLNSDDEKARYEKSCKARHMNSKINKLKQGAIIHFFNRLAGKINVW